MARTTTYTQFLAAPPEAVWAVVGDPGRWPHWHPGITSVVLHGPAEPGTTGDCAPSGRMLGPLHRRTAEPFTITELTPGRAITIDQPDPLGRVRISWRLRPSGAGTELTQELTFTGPFAAPARAVLGRALEGDLRVSFARLARLSGIEPGPDALTVVIAGGTGSLGRHLAADLTCRAVRVVVLTRTPDPRLPFEQQRWDGETVGEWAAALDNPGPTAVVNLAGQLVDCRPTPANIAVLRDSRVRPTRALVEAAASLDRPLAHWVQASTTAIWSDAGETRCTESTPLPIGLPQMTGVARPWENALTGANTRHHVVLRTSVVLDPQAPALRMLCRLTSAGLGGRIGSGEQWFSWIHLADWLAVVRAALGLDPDVTLPSGIVVAATDFPVRNRDLMAALRRHLRRPPAPPTPAAVLRLGALVLRTDPALGLTGRHATSTVLREAGYRFRYPCLDDALRDLLPQRTRAS